MPDSANTPGKRLAAVALLLAGFALSRLLFAAAGVRMHDDQLAAMWQLADLPLLEAQPLAAPLCQHGVPPGYGMLVGLVSRFAGGHRVLALSLIYWSLGLVVLFAVYGLLRHFRFPRTAAAALALLFIVSPEAVLYEHWPFTTWPVAAMLAAAAWLLSRFERRGGTAPLAGFFALLALAGLFRSAWHPLFLAAVTALLAAALPGHRKRVAVCGGAALALLLLPAVKNGLLFGSWSGSSWFGMSLWKVASAAAPPEQLRAMAADGRLPEVASLPSFQCIDAYPAPLRAVPARYAGDPLLAAARKHVSGAPNFNHYGFIAVGRAYEDAALALILQRPDWYARGVAAGCVKYCCPSWWYGKVWDNRLRIEPYIRWTRLIPLREAAERRLGAPASWDFPFSSLLFLPLCGVVVAAGLLLRRRSAGQRPRIDATTRFMLAAVLYVFLAVSLVEVGENNRFRVETDPLCYVLFLVAARELVRVATPARPCSADPAIASRSAPGRR